MSITWRTTDRASSAPHEMWDVTGAPPWLTVSPSIDVEYWRPDSGVMVRGTAFLSLLDNCERNSAMGHWSIHIEGAGLHGNGRDDDADAMLKVFAGELADAGHQVHLATITTGNAKELLNADDTTPFARAGAEDGRRPLTYRDRIH